MLDVSIDARVEARTNMSMFGNGTNGSGYMQGYSAKVIANCVIESVLQGADD